MFGGFVVVDAALGGHSVGDELYDDCLREALRTIDGETVDAADIVGGGLVKEASNIDR